MQENIGSGHHCSLLCFYSLGYSEGLEECINVLRGDIS